MRAIGFAFALIVLAACAPSAMPLPPTATANAQASPIDYFRSGGFVGVNDHLTVDLNGHATLTRRTGNFEFDLTRDELAAIQAALQTADLTALPENSMPPGVPADGFSYTISYRGHTVKTADTAVPNPLEPVFARLNQIIDTRGK